MSYTKYYTEYSLTGDTTHDHLQIEDYLYLNKPRPGYETAYGTLGIGVDPITTLDVYGQIRLSTGTTNYEGELRYKYSNHVLYVNTGGTTSSWVNLLQKYDIQNFSWIEIDSDVYSAIPAGSSGITLTGSWPADALIPGVAIRWLSGNTYYYDQVVSYDSGNSRVYLRGSTMGTGSCINKLYYSNDRGMIHVETFIVPGNYADSADNTLLEDDLLMKGGYSWRYRGASLVGLDVVHTANDTGALTQPKINVRVGGSDVFSSALGPSTTLQSTNNLSNAITVANYDVSYGDRIELTAAVASGGSPNNDANDLTAYLVFVMDKM
jgi:hypothetical protein